MPIADRLGDHPDHYLAEGVPLHIPDTRLPTGKEVLGGGQTHTLGLGVDPGRGPGFQF